MDTGTKLWVACAVLGALVVLLGAMYAYVYYTQIKPRRGRVRQNPHMLHQGPGGDNPEGEGEGVRYLHIYFWRYGRPAS